MKKIFPMNDPAFDALLVTRNLHDQIALQDPVPSLYYCHACGCYFLPDTVNGVIYPDRFVFVDSDGNVRHHNCVCHQLEYEIEPEDLPDE